MARKKTTRSKKKTTKKKASTSAKGSASRSTKKRTTKSRPASKSTTKKRAATTASAPQSSGTAQRSTSSKTAARTSRTTRAKTSSTAKTRGSTTGKEARVQSGRNRTPSTAPVSHDNNGNGNGHGLSDEQLRKVKTGLTKRDIQKFERLLLEKRAELVGDVESLQTDARNGGNAISYEHMADVGTDSYEQEFTLGLVESERKLLREIDEALDRIRKGTYGVCIESGQPIGKPRLEAKPWAKYCIEVARDRERRGL